MFLEMGVCGVGVCGVGVWGGIVCMRVFFETKAKNKKIDKRKEQRMKE